MSHMPPPPRRELHPLTRWSLDFLRWIEARPSEMDMPLPAAPEGAPAEVADLVREAEGLPVGGRRHLVPAFVAACRALRAALPAEDRAAPRAPAAGATRRRGPAPLDDDGMDGGEPRWWTE